MLITGLFQKNARLAIALTAALLISLFLCLTLGRAAFAVVDYDGDGAVGTADCKPYDSAVAPGKPDKPDLQHEDTNCDGIDGDRTDAIWVSVSGNDSSTGADPANPKRTIAAAITAAAAQNKDVYITGGDYQETVNVVSNVGLYG
ncbi:MAG TPA: hypothetical protein VFI90_02915, partial [Rubrobacter sp.]|nr:hypothetical protein [Rubrobacter sp.]